MVELLGMYILHTLTVISHDPAACNDVTSRFLVFLTLVSFVAYGMARLNLATCIPGGHAGGTVAIIGPVLNSAKHLVARNRSSHSKSTLKLR